MSIAGTRTIISDWKIHETDEKCLWFSTVFESIPIDPIFKIEFDSDTPFSLCLARNELEFLSKDAISNGGCGHVSIIQLRDNQFVVRDDMAMLRTTRVESHTSPIMRTNGAVYEKLKCVAKCVLDDIDQLHQLIKTHSGEITLTRKDIVFVKQIIVACARFKYIHTMPEVGEHHFTAAREIVTSLDLQQLNEFLRPSMMKIEDVDIGKIVTRNDSLFASQIVTHHTMLPSACWINHNYTKSKFGLT